MHLVLIAFSVILLFLSPEETDNFVGETMKKTQNYKIEPKSYLNRNLIILVYSTLDVNVIIIY